MNTKSGRRDGWAEFMGTPKKPLEIFVDSNRYEETEDNSKETNSMMVAFRCLQQGFGFTMGVHNLTVCEYADILTYLQPTTSDVISGLSTFQTLLNLENNYLGPVFMARLVRLTDRRDKGKCAALESMVVAHQYALCTVCGKGGLWGPGQETPGHNTPKPEQHVSTWCGFRYCAIIPPLCGMRDVLRVVDAPIASVTLSCERSTLFSREGRFPAKGKTLAKYCWSNTILSEDGCNDEALFVVYTLFPSMSSGLLPEKMKTLGIYVTITEEIVRGHSGARGKKGNYYEWVPPIAAGTPRKRVQTLYLTMGCSIVVPSTCLVRLGSHPKEDVVVFIHAVHVTLTGEDKLVFMKRPASYHSPDLDEYANYTDFLERGYRSKASYVDWNEFLTNDEQQDLGVVGTIPSVVNVPLNTETRLKLVKFDSNLRLGTDGILDAYRKTPVFKLRHASVGDGNPDDADAPEDGVHVMGLQGDDRHFIENVPYEFFEYVLGTPLPFPLGIGEVWEAEKEQGSDFLSSSQSSSATESEESEGERSE